MLTPVVSGGNSLSIIYVNCIGLLIYSLFGVIIIIIIIIIIITTIYCD